MVQQTSTRKGDLDIKSLVQDLRLLGQVEDEQFTSVEHKGDTEVS